MAKYKVIKGNYHDFMGGRCYKEGDEFSAEKENSLLVAAIRKGKVAKLQDEAQPETPQSEAETPQSEAETPKRKRKRKTEQQQPETEGEKGGENG